MPFDSVRFSPRYPMKALVVRSSVSARRSIATVFVFATFLASGAALTAQTATAVVAGRVINQTTQAALLGATVTLEPDPRVAILTEDVSAKF